MVYFFTAPAAFYQQSHLEFECAEPAFLQLPSLGIFGVSAVCSRKADLKYIVANLSCIFEIYDIASFSDVLLLRF